MQTPAVEGEVVSFLATYEQERIGDGRARLLRHGHLKKRDDFPFNAKPVKLTLKDVKNILNVC